MSDDTHIGGWRIDHEDAEYLDAIQSDSPVLAMRGHYNERTADPRELLKIEHQGPQGACQGHAITSVCEWCAALASGSADLQLSRAMGYYETQRIDELKGDKGSTISGGVKLATSTGICEESLWPYPKRYNSRRPDNWQVVMDNAKQHKIMSTYRLKSYDAIRTFLGSGSGAISIGVRWGRGMSNAVLDAFAPGRGGHAVGLFSVSPRTDEHGDPYIWMMNSWGKQWANKGWSEWAPRAVRQMCRDRYTVAIGCSDMPGVEPRAFDVDDWKRELKIC